MANSGQTVIIDSCLNDYAVITVLCYVHKEGRSNIIQKISVQVKSIVALCMYIDSIEGQGRNWKVSRVFCKSLKLLDTPLKLET